MESGYMWLILSKNTSSSEIADPVTQDSRLTRFGDIFVGQRTFVSLVIKPPLEYFLFRSFLLRGLPEGVKVSPPVLIVSFFPSALLPGEEEWMFLNSREPE